MSAEAANSQAANSQAANSAIVTVNPETSANETKTTMTSGMEAADDETSGIEATDDETSAGDTGVADLCFSARALAQTHPMTAVSHRYRQECLERERRQQPVSELADWAATSLLVGYCLRRCEEQAAQPATNTGADSEAGTAEADSVDASCDTGAEASGAEADRAEADRAGAGTAEVDLHRVNALSESLRAGNPASVTLLEPDLVVAALDRLIATELDKRHEHLREQLDDDAWTELGDYLAWWVIHGYALRASEQKVR